MLKIQLTQGLPHLGLSLGIIAKCEHDGSNDLHRTDRLTVGTSHFNTC